VSSVAEATTSAGSGNFPRFRPEDLTAYSCAVLERLGVPSYDARQVAECLVKAELRGVDSHGLIRLPVYAKRIQANVVKARPSITVDVRYASVALVDGDNGLGPVVGARAMDEALRLAENCGIGFAGVRRSNHFGAAAFYVERAIARRCIGCAISNAPPNMAAFGGRERFLGTNPLAVGIPAGRERPLIFDASSSVVARGKIIVAAQRDLPIPDGWAIDPEGRPTTDARAALAGAVLPFGGPKGSAISFLIDILSGVMTGAAFALHLNTLENLQAEQNLGHLFAAFRTDLFLPADEFSERMDEILRMLKTSAPALGVPRVLAPGELELDTESQYRLHGLPLTEEVTRQLVDLGNQVGVDFPSCRDGARQPEDSSQ
jgi:LDH2 family malate/lactate/ureidoglycolate dehydrogenase